jgi:hypothetical protein
MKTIRDNTPCSTTLTVITLLLVALAIPISLTAQEPLKNQIPSKLKFATQVNFDGSNGANPYLMFLVQGTDGDLSLTVKINSTHSSTTQSRIHLFKPGRNLNRMVNS